MKKATVFEGCRSVGQEGAEPFRAQAGSLYFVNPDFPHVETAEVDSLSRVTQGGTARAGCRPPGVLESLR